jgi:uncharacterized protein
MIRRFLFLLLLFIQFAGTSLGQQSRFNVLAFYTASGEPDHIHFAEDAVKFFRERAASEHFTFDATTRWEDLNDEHLKNYQLILWLNDSPSKTEQRSAFERFMQHGGAWLGFHAAGYNDKDTNWPWFVDFLGGAVFHINSWPPLPAQLEIDDPTHPIFAGIPGTFESPSNEWYVWKPSPRLNKDVRVLATFDPANYPLGFKDILTGGDLPVVWTNTKYKMLYMNMGHGDKIWTSPVQNRLIDNALNWLGAGANQAGEQLASGIQINPRGIVLNSHTDKFYAVNTRRGIVTVLDGAGQFLAQVQAGKEPEAIAINPDTNKIYVTNEGSGTVTVIDGATDRVIATVAVGDLPYAIAVNPATDKVYLSRTFSNDMTVIDGKTNSASTLKVGVQADAIAVDPVANKIYLTGYQDREITVIDGTNDRLSKSSAEIHLWAIAANSTTHKIYAASAGNANVAITDGKSDVKSGATKLVSTGSIPCAIAVDSSSGRVFVANYAGSTVSVIDGSSDTVVATMEVARQPQAIAVDEGNHRVYVASPHEGTTTILDGAGNSVMATVKTGGHPFAIAADSKTHKAVVLGFDGELTVIDGTTSTTSSPVISKNTQ